MAEEMFRIIIKSMYLFNTSIEEGLSNSIMEAMSFGLPIVATSAGDSEYLVKDNFNGYICKAGDSSDLAEKLYRLISDEDLRNQFSEIVMII
ncbi:MAG: glycosyltransferase family 4 protein [Bacteroidales bacterium]|nr:glycosyltransferase family 4 protein [Bacteroidales bacterium]